MKSRRFLSALLCLTLLLTLLAPAALANSWGLKSGMILNAVSKTHDYDEYTALAQLKLPDGEVAVMASRYHAVLLYAYQFKGELRLEASHTAVKQPDEKDYKKGQAAGRKSRLCAQIQRYGAAFLPVGRLQPADVLPAERQDREIDPAARGRKQRVNRLADVQRW